MKMARVGEGQTTPQKESIDSQQTSSTSFV